MTDSSLPWTQHTYVAFDTETSGKFPLVAEIVELAAAKWQGGKIVDTFQTFVKPQRLMGEAVIAIHHITNEMVASSPPIKDVLPGFQKFIEGSILVAHHAAYDLGFLALEYDKLSWPLPTNSVLDSCLLARKLFPTSINHRLATLATLFNIKQAQAHRALDDSQTCLEIMLKCAEAVGGLSTLEDLFKAQGGPLLWPRYSMSGLLEDPIGKVLVEACKGQLVIEITYRGGTQSGQPRRLTPQGLVRTPEGDFIVGLCHIENTEKRFFLNRILSAKILD